MRGKKKVPIIKPFSILEREEGGLLGFFLDRFPDDE